MSSARIIIRRMVPDDWDSVRTIYADGLSTGNATFETVVPEWDVWDANHLSFARLVAVDEHDNVLGWAALSPVSRRDVYRGVAEVSVYVGAGSRGHGVGKTLLNELITASEANGIWTLQASIFPENDSSVQLHRNGGFREVGTREAIAQRDGVWRNTVWLERRSRVVGTS